MTRIPARKLKTAFFFEMWRATPVFHAWAPGGKTICGRRLFDGNCRTLYSAALRPSHALKFGRPCRQCFTDGGSA